MKQSKKSNAGLLSLFFLLCGLAVVYVVPIFIVLMNSFKGKFFISRAPFAWPDAQTFIGLQNYVTGLTRIEFFKSFGYSLFITVFSTVMILLCSSMTAWYIVRRGSRFTQILYYLFVCSMLVPFQMVMFTMVQTVKTLGLDNPLGIQIAYLGFGSGLSVFMFVGFIKQLPLAVEEAAFIDGCSPPQTFFKIVVPIMKPTLITVALLNAMWIWNDYLLPTLVLGNDYRTLPMAIQGVLTGSYGDRDMGALMAMLVLTIVPIIIFYAAMQKHIIKGVVAGAVKG